MALNGNTQWEVRTTGSDTVNGGGFNPGNANFPTDGTTTAGTGNTASPVFSSASYTFVAGDVGAWLFIKSGTNSNPGWYQIASVAAGKATLTAGAGTWVVYVSSSAQAVGILAGIATVGTPTALTWGIDYSQQAAAQIAFADMVIDATTATKFTSAANPVGKNYVGNIIRVTGGTGFTVQYVEVVSTLTTTATCDKSLGTLSSTGGTGGLGGCFASLAPFTATAPELTANFYVHIAAGTYSHSVQPILRTNFFLIGYGTIRSDNAARPILQTTLSGAIIGTDGASPYTFYAFSIDFDGNSVASSTTFVKVSGVASLNFYFVNCIVRRMGSMGCGNGSTGGGVLVNCQVYSNGANGINPNGSAVTLRNCIIRDNTGHGAGDGGSLGTVIAVNTIFARNTLMGISAYNMTVDYCTFHSNTGQALGCQLATVTQYTAIRNTIMWGNGAGIKDNITPGSGSGGYLLAPGVYYCIAGGSNTSGTYATGLRRPLLGDITLTADPCTNAAGNDFSLNTAAGGGALCRGAGFPGVFPGGSSTGYDDIGAVQHADPAGGGSRLAPVLQPNTWQFVG